MYRADGRVRHGLAVDAREACDAEVHDLYGAVLEEHDVLRLDIAVYYTLVMRVLKRPEYLRNKVYSFSPVYCAFLLNIILESDTVDILHDDILDSVAKAYVVNFNDIRV